MALTLVLTKTSISSNCATQVWTDSTGDYHVTTNPTGYGSPNAARSTLYLFFSLSLRKSTGREDITVAAYNNLTASTWSMTITEDGWYEGYIFACPIYAAGTAYALNEITYDLTTDKYYKSLQAANLAHAVTDTAWWLTTNDVEDFNTAVLLPQSGVYEITKNILEQCRSNKCLGQMQLKETCSCNDNASGIPEYEKVRLKIEAALYNSSDGNWTEAQEVMEDLNYVCEALEDCNCH